MAAAERGGVERELGGGEGEEGHAGPCGLQEDLGIGQGGGSPEGLRAVKGGADRVLMALSGGPACLSCPWGPTNMEDGGEGAPGPFFSSVEQASELAEPRAFAHAVCPSSLLPFHHLLFFASLPPGSP